jgi:two-component system nitrogen regulation response regulator GlnG
MAHLLLIDDDPALIPKLVRQVFAGPDHRVEVAGTGADGLERVSAMPPDVILLDLHLPDQSGLDVYQQIRRIDARIPVIFVTMAKTADAAIEAMRQGAYDYLFKPLDPHNLRRVVGEALEVVRRMRQPAVVAETAPDPDVDGAIVGSCPAMVEVYKAIGRVAAQDVPVLINGESGTGKELVALAIYQHGPRAKAPFLALNCAAIPENLLESELFGHEKGTFTGADRRRIGKFEQCSGGTIFLDEIGEMPAILQAKLLQVLQDGTFSRLGSRSPMRVDVRVIAATNINMKEAIARKAFREDLYYRLNGFSLSIPPLCERREEIPLLANYFMRKVAKKYGRMPLPLSNQLLDAFSRYSWPGNLREMENVVNRYFILGDERPIFAEMNPYTPFRSESNGLGDAADGGGLKQIVRSLKGEAEATAIAQMLETKGWNRKAAASELQISYKALLYKIKQYELAPKRA